MDGDLNLSESLGGLRIANPDNFSPDSSTTGSTHRPPPSSPLSPLSPLPPTSPTNPSSLSREGRGTPPAPSLPINGLLRSTSPLDFNPRSFSTEATAVNRRPSPANLGGLSPVEKSKPIDRTTYAQRQANRQSIPLTYQDQQQAQFPQYPTMMPLSQRSASSSTRPVSAMFAQPPNINGDGGVRDGYPRQRNDSSRQSIQAMPQRSSSRGATTAMNVGGAPAKETQYRQPHNYAGAPPRKSSRGMGIGQVSGDALPTQNGGTPYGLEGGPLKSSEEWQEKGAAVGVRQELDASGRPVLKAVKKGVKDFQFGRVLGEGSYSTVIAATDRQTRKEYAIKVLDKRHIIKEKKVKYVNIEKDTLNRLTDHPGVVRLYYTFQDQQSLYFVLDLASSGELLGVLKKTGTFDEECTRFYGAEILDTIDYMHAKGVIHRDLKPENVLLDDKMHVKITDFGTAKIMDSQSLGNNPVAGDPLDGTDEDKGNSFVGTAEYVSPELLTDKLACKASDLWAFGCIIYQLLAGRPPFKAANEYLTFQKIVALDYQFPAGFPAVTKDLVERLLVLDPTSRLSIEHVKNHEFFYGVSWGRSLWRQKAPKLKPFVPLTSDLKKPHSQPNGDADSFPPNIAPSHSTSAKRLETPGGSMARPGPRIITELPPPSQLDIEWSPVLTRNNERILKLGNLLVNVSPGPHSPSLRNGVQSAESDTPKKRSRLFGGGNGSKKRQRLVMVTSSARIIVTASGEEKKPKIEIPLLSAGCAWNKLQDPKGLTYWCVETQDKHYSFEDPKSAGSDGLATSASAQEWIDTIEKARELALSQNLTASYSGDDALKDLSSGPSSSTRGLDLDSPGPMETESMSSGRHMLQKHIPNNDDSFMGRKRFSKRQSKSGLAAVF